MESLKNNYTPIKKYKDNMSPKIECSTENEDEVMCEDGYLHHSNLKAHKDEDIHHLYQLFHRCHRHDPINSKHLLPELLMVYFDLL
jgi:hypothetical protein